MIESIIAFLAKFAEGIVHQLPAFVAVAAVFTVIGALASGKRNPLPWWKKPDLFTDLAYSFVLPVISSWARLAFLVLGAAAITGSLAPERIDAYLSGGSGPLSALPFWGQVMAYLLLADLMMYWTHRIFHDASLWKYHAIHHSSEHLDWVSAFRFHPVNTIFHAVLADAVLLLAGVAPEVLVMLVPFQAFMSALVHADLDWDFGPFRHVLASPVFHRWHHTDPARGGEKNFAATFPILDVIFGTFYMPKGVVPKEFGVDDKAFPKDFAGQLLYPFRPAGGEAAAGPSPAAAPETKAG